jgi:hypothetical protein
MSLSVRQERFSPFGGASIDVCAGCGEDITPADGSCVLIELTPTPHGRLHVG